MRKLRRIRHDDRGESLIEFAASAALLLTVIFGIMDCSRALYVYHFISYAAQQGTRYAIVRGANWKGTSCTSTTAQDCDATATAVQSYVQSIAPPSVTASDLIVTTTWPGQTVTGDTEPCDGDEGTSVNGQGCAVKVQVSYSFSFLLPFLPKSAMEFSASSEQSIQE
jgi:Flp pilus assembly protein TadG